MTPWEACWVLPTATTESLIARLGLEERSVYRAKQLSPSGDPHEWFGWGRTTDVAAHVYDAVMLAAHVAGGATGEFGPDKLFPRPGTMVDRDRVVSKPARVADMNWGGQLGLA